MGHRNRDSFKDRMLEAVERRSRLANTKLNHLLRQGAVQMAMFSDLQREVAETRGVVDSAVVFIQGIRDQLAALIAAGSVTPAQLQEVVDSLDQDQQKLAASIAANPTP